MLERVITCLQAKLQNLQLPGGQLGVKAVVDPLPRPPVGDQACLSQGSEMTRDLRLNGVQCGGEFTYTKFTMADHELQAGQASGVAQQAKEVIGVYMFHGLNIQISSLPCQQYPMCQVTDEALSLLNSVVTEGSIRRWQNRSQSPKYQRWR